MGNDAPRTETRRILIRISPALYETVREMAEADGRSIAQTIRTALLLYTSMAGRPGPGPAVTSAKRRARG